MHKTDRNETTSPADNIEGNSDQWPFADPRVQGISDHFNRVHWFLDCARRMQDPHRTWVRLAAVYSARACVEIMLEAAQKEQIQGFNRDTFEEWMRQRLRFYILMEKIRIHDFHRFGIFPPDPNWHVDWMGGPVKFTGGKGAASLQMTENGPKRHQSGNVQIKEQRPLYIRNGQFFDDDTNQFVDLENVIYEFWASLPPIIVKFQKLNEVRPSESEATRNSAT